jgi:hypothetical protein
MPALKDVFLAFVCVKYTSEFFKRIIELQADNLSFDPIQKIKLLDIVIIL